MKAKDVLAVCLDWHFNDTFYVCISDNDDDEIDGFEVPCYEFMMSAISEYEIKGFMYMGKNKNGNYQYYIRIKGNKGETK